MRATRVGSSFADAQARRWCPKAEDRRQPTGAPMPKVTEAAQPRRVRQGCSFPPRPAVRAQGAAREAQRGSPPARAHRAVVLTTPSRPPGPLTRFGAGIGSTPRTAEAGAAGLNDSATDAGTGKALAPVLERASQAGRKLVPDRPRRVSTVAGRRRITQSASFPGSGSSDGVRSTAGSDRRGRLVGRYLMCVHVELERPPFGSEGGRLIETSWPSAGDATRSSATSTAGSEELATGMERLRRHRDSEERGPLLG